MYRLKFASAFGAGSVAVTLRPRARYSAAQLAPMTPVPTIVTFRISFFFAIPSSLNCFNSQPNFLTDSNFDLPANAGHLPQSENFSEDEGNIVQGRAVAPRGDAIENALLHFVERQ